MRYSIDLKVATDALKTASKRSIQKAAEETGNLIGNKIADKIIKVSRSLPQNSSETVESETEIPVNGISKMISLLDKSPYQPFKFSTKNWTEINDDSRGTYNINSQIKFKAKMLKSSLCDYSAANMLVI